jgi:hypothetical protein
MQRIERTYEQIAKYLKGLLSNRERHNLEKEVMQDTFEEEAFDGLTTLSGEEFEAAMSNLNNRLDARIAPKQQVGKLWFYRIAASVILLMGLGTALFLIVKQPEQELITQEIPKIKNTIVSVESNDSIEAPVKESADKGAPFPGKQDNKKSVRYSTPYLSEPESPEGETMASAVSDEEVYPTVEIAAQEMDEMVLEEKREEAIAGKAKEAESYENNYITGRVLGVNREALAGVTIQEKGSKRSTITDLNGYFKMQLSDSDSRLAFNYIGYKSAEVSSKEAAGNEISLEENLLALNEVVVVGYGTRSRAGKSAAPADKRMVTDDYRSPGSYSKPVPPGGSLAKFESWVEEQIDTLKLMTILPGNYKIRVNMHINEDGTLDNLLVKDDVPGVVAEEYKRAVLLSPPWKPATSDTLPVDAEIMIEFLLMVR